MIAWEPLISSDEFDLLIVGAGPVGCVIAERAASELGWSSIVVDKRDHIAGNCYDRKNESGLWVHQYGPHYFRTNDIALLDYLSRFTDWIPGNYIVKSFLRGELYPFPINLTTIERFFGCSLTSQEAETLLESLREKIDEPKNSEELVLSRVGRELYESFYLNYTLKQWGRHPRTMDPTVCGRIPIRFNRDERYVNHRFQLTPALGFTSMFGKMLASPRIRILLKTDYWQIKAVMKPKHATVFCGPIDEYFENRLGELPWRSLEFRFEEFAEELRQPCVQINYPNDFEFTRTVEIKHITGQKHPRTVISYEYPRSRGEPFYPVPDRQGAALYARYLEMAQEETRRHRVFFAGRLACYRYINTDEAIGIGLDTFEEIRRTVSYGQIENQCATSHHHARL